MHGDKNSYIRREPERDGKILGDHRDDGDCNIAVGRIGNLFSTLRPIDRK